jgi:hypothetical protein
MYSHNEMLSLGTNSGSSALPSPRLPLLCLFVAILLFVRVFPSSPPWHTSCPKTASMWKQGCIQLNHCPNSVHVPRHSPALRTRAHRPSSEPFNLQPQSSIAPGDFQFTYKHLQNFPPPKADFRKLSKFSGKNFFATANLQPSPWNPMLPMHSTILKEIESVCESVVKIRNTCRLAGYEFLKVLKMFFSSAASQSGQLANVTTNMTPFCKCL